MECLLLYNVHTLCSHDSLSESQERQKIENERKGRKVMMMMMTMMTMMTMMVYERRKKDKV